MKAKDGSSGFIAGITKSILANKVTLFFCWIGLMVLFAIIVLHKGYEECWFEPLIYGLIICGFVFGIWWVITKHEHLPFQSILGWLIVAVVLIIMFIVFAIVVDFLWNNPQWFPIIAICLAVVIAVNLIKKKWLRYLAAGLIILAVVWLWGKELLNLFQPAIEWTVYYFNLFIYYAVHFIKANPDLYLLMIFIGLVCLILSLFIKLFNSGRTT